MTNLQRSPATDEKRQRTWGMSCALYRVHRIWISSLQVVEFRLLPLLPRAFRVRDLSVLLKLAEKKISKKTKTYRGKTRLGVFPTSGS